MNPIIQLLKEHNVSEEKINELFQALAENPLMAMGIVQQLGIPPEKLQALTKAKGLFSFYEDGHKECCGVRKIAPLKRKLTTLDAWITGQRKDQSPGTRTEIDLCEKDNFPGASEVLYKYNPLANWTSAQVWEYIKIFDVPFNDLHNQGYISIGCEPCTRPVLPNQHEREGRWWWEGGDHKECGLHAGNIIGKG